jgi:hypothetical protein
VANARTPRKVRQSIQPTYDQRLTGDRFLVATSVGGKALPTVETTDPFVHHRISVGWPDLLRGLLRRRLEVIVAISADPDMVEDVMELNADYLGTMSSTRRQEWNAQLERGLGDFAAQIAEHESDA